jgi:signal transduction histidine kinase
MRRKNNVASILGSVFFFVTVSVIATIAILIYNSAVKAYDRNIVTLIMAVTIIVLALICTMVDVFRRKIMVEKPLEKILQAMERLGRGDFSVRVSPDHPYGKYSEYDVIIYHINKVADNLGKSQMLNNNFISNVSHEIKTPLAIISSYASLLKNPTLDQEERNKYLETLSSATERLGALVANVLTLNKLENGALDTEKSKVNLASALSDAIIAFEDVIDKKGIEIDTDLDEVCVLSYPSCLELVWNNLISNAVKFTEKGGKISVSVKIKDGKAVVSVKDSGCGISKQTGERIFDKFYQGDTSHSKEGNGLGLALVKKVIDLTGGEILVESQENKGSTFTVVLKEAIV